MNLVVFGMQNRTFGPYLAASDRILIPVLLGRYLDKLWSKLDQRMTFMNSALIGAARAAADIAETSRTQFALLACGIGHLDPI
jgi:hypothetical protein